VFKRVPAALGLELPASDVLVTLLLVQQGLCSCPVAALEQQQVVLGK
jgi:hypothetical protein